MVQTNEEQIIESDPTRIQTIGPPPGLRDGPKMIRTSPLIFSERPSKMLGKYEGLRTKTPVKSWE